MDSSLEKLEKKIVGCRRCPRLVAWREKVARVKRAAYRNQEYWGRPVPGFGDPRARLLIVGLAPGAHGANRTGRMFTGDRSGDFLYAALHRHGFASQATSASRHDGLALHDCFITAPVRCVPPDNLPTPAEIATCRPYLERELAILKPKAYLALGAIAWNAILDQLDWPRPRPAFHHGAHEKNVFACYHVSQQNTQTGRLTVAMIDEVLSALARYLDPA